MAGISFDPEQLASALKK